ncbi:MAG: dihydrolipoamide acetyltransferase family protein [Chloroflexota bacterium]
MRREIVMPRLSDAVEEGVVVTWFVEPGAIVREGDLVAEIQVEKAASEVRAPAAGRVEALLVEPGGIVPQGAPIAVLEAAEAVETEGGGAAAPVGAAVVTGEVSAATGQAAEAGRAAATGQAAEAGRAISSRPASPAARRLARELGVDLSLVTGSGPEGRIIEADVLAAAERVRAAGPAAAPGPAAAAGAPAAGPGAGRTEPLTPMRRTIAERLRAGLAATAQLTITAEADLTALGEVLVELSETSATHITYTEAIVRAAALALRDHPRLTARLTGSSLTYPDRIDIGVAVALDDGLIVPVVRDVDHKDLVALRAEIEALAERARSGALAPAETEGGCFSVTNLGRYRVDAFTPLLNPPQTAILGVGRARPRPAVVDGAIVVRTLVVLSLTFDHQVVDGAPAAAFLDTLIDLLEHPERLLAVP